MKLRYLITPILAVGLVIGIAARGTLAVCAPAPIGPISWWSGDNNAFDARSRFSGTLVGNAGFSAGQFAQAFDLDGDGDSVQVAHTAAHNISGNFTAEAWIFARTLPNIAPRIFDKDNGGAGGFWQLSVANDGTSANALGFSATGVSLTSPNNSITLGQWNHVAVTVNANGTTLYINGAQVAFTASVASSATTAPLLIGNDFTGTRDFDGLIDEPAIYDRALTASEIQAIHNAGTDGKCKPTATAAPANLVAWIPGDGDAADIIGTNEGTLQNGAGHVVGRVGQALSFDGVDDRVAVTSDGVFRNQPGGSIEVWVRPTGLHGGGNGFVYYEDLGTSGFARFAISVFDDGRVRVLGRDAATGAGGTLKQAITSEEPPLNQWTHVVATWEVGVGLKVFINGALAATFGDATATAFDNVASQAVRIGAYTDGGGSNFNGHIDELSMYHRVLTAAEILSLSNAGVAGKLKQAATLTGTNVTVDAGGEPSVTFPNVASAGVTQSITLDGTLFPALTNGTAQGLSYDIQTTAVYTGGDPTVCFLLPYVTTADVFGQLQVQRLVSGTWDGLATTRDFATRTICAASPTLNGTPFAISLLAPTAAPASITGRVTDQRGRPIRGAFVAALSSTGESVSAVTNSFGNYRLDGLEAGQGYIVSVRAKGYNFGQGSVYVDLADSVSGLDFQAAPARFETPQTRTAPTKTAAPTRALNGKRSGVL